MTGTPDSPPICMSEVITATGVASSIMNCRRWAGYAGSIGTYVAPVLRTPRIAVSAWSERRRQIATVRPISDVVLTEEACEPVGLCVEFGVGDLVVTIVCGHGIRASEQPDA